MFKLITFVYILYVGVFSASATLQDENLRYQYASDSNGEFHLVDSWTSISDLLKVGRYNPGRSNVYHLFTRQNPTLSQPLVVNNADLLSYTNYNSTRRTVVLIHGWRNSAVSPFNTVLVPALLAAEDLNVIVVDWSAGANSIDYREVNRNSLLSAASVATFIRWLNEESGSTLEQYHIIGHGVGGHQAGNVGRNLDRKVSYITGLDPSLIGWANSIFRFNPFDAVYTEVIHTNYGVNGYLSDLARVDFYPNRGLSMPGCNSNACDHDRSFHYFAESVTSGGFTGRECANYYAAILGWCNEAGRLQMGGLVPKIGRRGVFLLETNSAPPFSLG